MRYAPIEYWNAFMLEGRKIANGDKLELKWPDGQTALVTMRLVGDELRIAGIAHGVKCWIVLNLGVRKQEIWAAWPQGETNGQAH